MPSYTRALALHVECRQLDGYDKEPIPNGWMVGIVGARGIFQACAQQAFSIDSHSLSPALSLVQLFFWSVVCLVCWISKPSSSILVLSLSQFGAQILLFCTLCCVSHAPKPNIDDVNWFILSQIDCLLFTIFTTAANQLNKGRWNFEIHFFWFGEVKIRKNTTISKKYGDSRKSMVKYFEFIWWRTLEKKLMKNIGAAERYLWVNEMSFAIALISISVNEDKGKLRTDRSIWDGLLLTLPLNCGDVASWGGRRMIYSDAKMNCCFFFPIVIAIWSKCKSCLFGLAALFSSFSLDSASLCLKQP